MCGNSTVGQAANVILHKATKSNLTSTQKAILQERAFNNPASLIDKTSSLHLTAGALLLSDNFNILIVKHKTLRRWYLPGGHLESSDFSAYHGALRELREETGISDLRNHEFGSEVPEPAPVYVDFHEIPATSSMPVHHHINLIFAFRTNECRISPKVDEVDEVAWKHSSSFDLKHMTYLEDVVRRLRNVNLLTGRL